MDTPAPAPTDGGTDFPYVTPAEYADHTGRRLHTVYRDIHRGKVPAREVGRRRYLIPFTAPDAAAS